MDVDPTRDENMEEDDDGEWTKPKRRQNKKRKADQENQTPWCKCENCDEIFDVQSDLTKHKELHVLKDRYQCLNCEKAFEVQSHLQKHEQIHMKDKNNSSVHVKPSEGEDSSERFSGKSQLSEHEKTHASGTLFRCKIC